jgi:hypothetical protein
VPYIGCKSRGQVRIFRPSRESNVEPGRFGPSIGRNTRESWVVSLLELLDAEVDEQTERCARNSRTAQALPT